GNAVLLKPAPNTALSVLMLEGFFSESFTIQVFKTVLSDTTLVPKIIADPRVQGVSLTGSDKAGSKVGALAGKYLKKSVLELGGCDPFIVFPDADVMLAAKLAVHSRINNTGQTCIAAKRLLVHKDIYKEFKDYLIHLFEELKMGDPIQESTQVSSLARADIRDILHVQYLDALAKGAKAIVEGGLVQGNGFYYNPALLENTNKKMLVRRQEVFGPLLTIQSFKDARDAIDQANDNRYGLGASIWTQNASLQQQMESKLQVGYIVFNNFVSSDPRIPFGGIKQSGYGRELGDAGIHEFTNLKSILYS
ncbi:MAG TPA: aldehyde dehydrogenase family protein, partial [Saprospiraceae bacterium]|nr:aldehyde dehydrogenase family protein [Saprospiraceae bacterium]